MALNPGQPQFRISSREAWDAGRRAGDVDFPIVNLGYARVEATGQEKT